MLLDGSSLFINILQAKPAPSVTQLLKREGTTSVVP